MFKEISIMELHKMFYKYLAKDPKELEGLPFYPVYSEGLSSTLSFMWLRHEGFCIIMIILCIELPFRFIEEKFFNVMIYTLHKMKAV
jgi:hypothetical protein